VKHGRSLIALLHRGRGHMPTVIAHNCETQGFIGWPRRNVKRSLGLGISNIRTFVDPRTQRKSRC